MSNGLDKILEDIRLEAEQSAGEIIAKAQSEADRIVETARKESEESRKKVRQEVDAAAQDAQVRSKSSAALAVRQKILAARQELIGEVLDKALEKARTLPDEAYFALLTGMAAKAAHTGKGRMILSEKDMKRLPAGFEASLQKALPAGCTLTVDADPERAGQIRDGFLLIYDGIEENCSFEAVLASRQEAVQDRIREIIFS